MSVIYDTMILSGAAALHVAHRVPRILTSHGKNRMFVDGMAKAMSTLAREFTPGDRNYWFHCSSLGEYAIARPIISAIKDAEPESRVALTFFSPTGVNALKAKASRHRADYVGYLPVDTHSHAKRLLDIIRPTAVAFMVSEYWPNYLMELHRRDIPTYLISAIFSHRAPHFKHVIGRTFRHSLEAYTRIFTLDKASCANLQSLGFTRVTQAGDPLVDNALAVAATDYSDPRLEAFTRGRRVMVCGSISDAKDLELCATLANTHPSERFIFVPHEVDADHLASVESALQVPHCRLSSLEPRQQPAEDCRVIIIDHIGSLAMLYRYGAMAYVGGGFTPQLHSIIEATVYGLPVAFGPRTERKVTPQQLCEAGVGAIVTSAQELAQWYDFMLQCTSEQLAILQHRAVEFCLKQSGATAAIADTIRGVRQYE